MLVNKHFGDKSTLKMMRKGYKEMGNINLSLAKSYFALESEVQLEYDCIVESE